MSSITENPRGGCVLAGANSVLGALARVCPIFHSGPGCCMQASAAEMGQSGNKSSCFVEGVSIPSTNMLEKQVVFGGVEKLRTTIRGAIDIIDADAYFVLVGCTAGIIGDDVRSVVDEFRSEGHTVCVLDTPGFEGDSNLGYELVWNAIVEQLVENPRKKNAKLVNVFGIVPYHDPFWAGNLEEVKRILEKLGLEVNTFFTDEQGIPEIRKSAEASLNIILNPWLFSGPAKKYEQKFGVESIRFCGLPIGATDTTEFVRKIGEKLNLDSELVEKVVAEEENYVYRYLAQSIGALSWKRFAVVGDSNTAIGITRYLANDYSFTPKLTIVTEPVFSEKAKKAIEARVTDLEYAAPPKVLFLSDQYEINQALRADDELTLIVGSSNEREIAKEKDCQMALAAFPLKERLVFNRAYAGYRGSLSLTEDLYDNL